MYRYISLKDKNGCKVVHGGRNVNQFRRDIDLHKANESTHRWIGNLKENGVYEVLIHPDFDGEKYLDRTNFDKNKVIYTLDDTIQKIVGFEKITYNDL